MTLVHWVTAEKSCLADGSSPNQLGAPTLTSSGTVMVSASYVNPVAFSILLADVATFKASLPEEQINTGLIAVQVAFGPARFLVSTALNSALQRVAGDSLANAKESAAIWLLSTVTGTDASVFTAENNAGKVAYANGASGRVLDGSAEVLGAEFLIDSAVQVAVGTISGVVGKVVSVKGAKGGAKIPQTVEEISNPPQAPVIPSGWVSRPGRNGGEIYFPAGTDPAKGEHIRVMPPGSSPVPGYEE